MNRLSPLFLFLSKELIELKHNKKIALFSVLGLLYPLCVNFLTYNPVVPLDIAFSFFSIILSTLSGEIVYWAIADEISADTFDVLLVSPVNKLVLILGKITLPIISTTLCVISGFLLSDAVATKLCEKALFSGAFCIENVIVIAFTASLSAILELFLSLIWRDRNLKGHTFFVVIEVIVITILFYFGRHTSIFFVIAMFIALPVISLFLIFKYISSPLKERRVIRLRRRDIMPQNMSPILSVVLCQLYAIPSWISLILRWTMLISLVIALGNTNNVLTYVIQFFVLSFGTMNVLYPSLIVDKEMKINAVIAIAISKRIHYWAKSIIPFMISQIGLLIMLSIYNKTKLYPHFSLLQIFLVELVQFLFLPICIFITDHYIAGKKDSRIGKIVIYLILATIYCLLVFITGLL